MIKSFITHKVLETCIELIFDGISKAFSEPIQDYKIIDFRCAGDFNDVCGFSIFT